MFSNSALRLFVFFSTLILFSSASSVLVLSRVLLEQQETAIYDVLALQAELTKEQIRSNQFQKKPLESDLNSGETGLLFQGGKAWGEILSSFDISSLIKSRPPNGTSVFSCMNTSGRDFFCSWSILPESNLSIFRAYPKTKYWDLLRSLFQPILGSVLALLILSLFLAWVFSKFLLKPLNAFKNASEKIARGEYSPLDLPRGRSDEFETLSQAFDRMVHDVSERERRITESGLKLAHSSRLASVGQMGAGIAHEVKNPLMAMQGYAKLLVSRVSEPDLKEAADLISKECQRCTQILAQLLRFSRNDQNESRPYLIRELIESTLLLLKQEARQKQIIIENEILSDSLVQGNPQQVQQVLLNLCLNAIHASPISGKIKIVVQEVGPKLQLEVIDYGVGIPLEVQDKIFDAFFTTKSQKEGSGLGLSIAKTIIEEQGGQIGFASSPAGTRFFFSLPLAVGA